ncbi:relaxase/mobilization nuclease domain-containing protein [Pedobacter aquatilis]|uniref:relaxase/mobilization nuclease domain-containing protein n=1 Tax=Pedobacter aquatilis TaxID=351343 RepID=UPI003977B464
MGQGKAVFLSAENYLKESHNLNPAENLFFLKHQASVNELVRTNCVHISLNFETSEKITSDRMQGLARDYMRR